MSSAHDLTIERLSAHAGFARALARGLLRDEHAAEDVLQDAYVAALESPPDRNVRAWFATVARRLSLNTIRAGRRRDARHAAVPAANPVVSPADLAARRDALSTVFRAVLALDEPFQTVVLLRFYEDLEPSQIAVRLGIPAATVRTRLHRALAQLRERLDEDNSGNRDAWCAALLPIAGMTRRSAVPVAAAGGLLVTTKLVLATGAVLVLALVAWMATSRFSESEASGISTATTSEPRDPAALRALAPRVAAPVAETSTETPDSPAPAAPPGPGRIAGRVVDERTGAPVAGAEILALAEGDASYVGLEKAKPIARTGSDGAFECAGLAAGKYFVVARAPGLLPDCAASVTAAEVNVKSLALVLRQPHSIAGRVIAPPGLSAAGTVVRTEVGLDRLASDWWWTNRMVKAVAAADGSFVLEGLPPREYDVFAELRTGDRRFTAGISSVPTDGPQITLSLEDTTPVVRIFKVHVLDSEGRPVTSGIARRYIVHYGSSTQGPATQEIRDGVVEIDGSDTVQFLWYEPFQFRDANGRDVAAAPVLAELRAPNLLEATVRLEPPASLEGRVHDASGRGVAGARIRARPSPSPLAKFGPEPHGEATSGDDGAFRIDGLARIEYALDVEVPPEFVAVAPPAARPGVSAEIELRAAVRPVVTALAPDGSPVPDAEIEARDGDSVVSRATTGADGTARLDRIEPGRPLTLAISPSVEAFAPQTVRDWHPADTTVHLLAGLTLRGKVVGRDGAPVPDALVVLHRADGAEQDYEHADENGDFEFEQLDAGSYQLVVWVSGREPGAVAATFRALAGDPPRVLTVDAGVTLGVTIEGWGDRNIGTRALFIEDGPAHTSHDGWLLREHIGFAALPPAVTGTIVAGPFGGGFLVFATGVRSDAGQVKAPLLRGVTLTGRFLVPAGAEPDSTEVFAEILGHRIDGHVDRRGRWRVEGVPEGTWTVRARAVYDERTLTAAASATAGVPADLELR